MGFNVRRWLIAAAACWSALALVILIAEGASPQIIRWARELSAEFFLVRQLSFWIAPNLLDLDPASYIESLRALLSRTRSIALWLSIATGLGAILVSAQSAGRELLQELSASSSQGRTAAVSVPAERFRLPGRISFVMLGAAGLAAAFSVLLFPTNMDEYLPYHPNACQQEEQQANIYREACGAYPIHLGPLTYERAYTYVGGTSSVLIAPLSAIERAPWTHFALGLGALVLTGMGLSASAGLGLRSVPAIGLFFPLVFALMRDTGPVRLSMVALAWTPFLLSRSVLGPRWWTRMTAGAAIMLLWGFATEDKPFFLFLIPMALLMAVGMASARGEMVDIARLRGRAALMVTLPTVVAVLVPIIARVPTEMWLLELAMSNAGLSRTESVLAGFRLLIMWPLASHRFLAWGEIGRSEIALLAIAAIIIAWVGWSLSRSSLGSSRVAEAPSGQWLLLAAVVGFASIVGSGGWAIHHFAFVLLPIAALFLLILGHNPNRRNWLVSGMLVSSLIGLSAPLWVEHLPDSGDDVRTAMNVAVDAAGPGEVVNCASWGCYYPYAYFGTDGVPVVFAVKTDDIQRLLKSVGPSGSAIFVCMVSGQVTASSQSNEGCALPNSAADIRENTEHLLSIGQWRVERIRAAG